MGIWRQPYRFPLAPRRHETYTAPSGAVTPTITYITPAYGNVGDPALTLTVVGTNYSVTSVVNWAGVALTTAFVSATMLTATIPAADFVALGVFAVTVTDGAQTSNAVYFTVNAKVAVPTNAWPYRRVEADLLFDMHTSPQSDLVRQLSDVVSTYRSQRMGIA